MNPLSWSRLALIGAVMAAVAWGLTRLLVTSGHTPLAVPWTVLLVAFAGGVLALGFGWSVRQYRKGRNPGLSPLRAARTVVYAQACAYAGVIIAGGYGGYGLALSLEWSHAPRRDVAISAFLAALGGLALAVAGAVAEHWCRDDSHDEKNAKPDPA